MLDFSQYLPITSPTLIFFVVLFIILIAPIVMGKLRIPHIIGMVLAGIVIGPYGLNILERDSSFELFGRVGLLYIMFLAGIEMDMEGLKKDLGKVTVFGLLTCFVPFILTYLSCVWYLGYPSLASLLLGCIMASNTLVAYPIVVRYGLQRSTVTTLSVGASMLSLLIALVVTAALVGSMSGDTGTLFWVMFFVKFVVWCIAMTWLIRHMTRWFLRRYSDSVMQYIFVLAVMFISAATCELIGLEGILGAFVSGLVLNRFIPNISPLMNRIEFIGNAIFIPYFLIGVGMLINAGLLLEGGNTILVVACIGIFGTLGKAIAAFLTSFFFHRSVHEGNLMFGMTSAHAAGAIALVMVGVNLEIAPGQHLLGDEALNAVVIMILFTCIISTVVTDYASRTIVLREKSQRKMPEDDGKADDEKILIPVKYPETCDTLLNMAMLMRNEKLSRGLIALNVVYDDLDATYNQQEGQRLLEQIEKKAAAADVQVQTQVRLATNIANGIKHAFKEYDASEIILGQHIHDNSTRRFWGQFAQSLFNGLNRQIIIARCTIPLNTIRVFHVAVPSRAEYEPGFYRWLERVSRMVTRLGCRILFHGRDESLSLIRTFLSNRFPSIRADYAIMQHWNDFKSLAAQVEEHQMLVVVTARPGTVSYKSAMERLPDELTTYYKYKNVMIIFPDQYGNHLDLMSFANTQHYEQESIWESIQNMLSRH
ncbi:MAG: cation:proton antiporter [Prevotella sp.]|nr:cation:proton antiporter [Prevotella sp.]MCI6510444.1 cation:proton antiporter [Prevotella sp.]MDD6535926.1 cation:proton antiporter [Prevotella sp.]MDD7067455.1 cation:proton antiporter [Prevotella sp.]MDY3966210.1 cation:proton antiporter [Prevotella sp.]